MRESLLHPTLRDGTDPHAVKSAERTPADYLVALQKHTADLNQGRVDARTFNDARHDEVIRGFDATFGELSGLKQPDVHAIAQAHLGYPVAPSTPKGKLLRMIQDRFALSARQTARMSSQISLARGPGGQVGDAGAPVGTVGPSVVKLPTERY